MGDPAGIGGEITLSAWRRSEGRGRAFYAIDDPVRLRKLAEQCGIDCPLEVITDPSDAVEAYSRALPVLEHRLNGAQTPGKPEPANAACVISSIERAVSDARAGRAAGIVTNPINKQALYEGAGFAFPGHTEFLGHLAGVDQTAMMLLSLIHI